MERAAIHLRIKDGQHDRYRAEHEDVHDTLERTYLESGAGLERFCLFEQDGHVFVYIEAEDLDSLKIVMEESAAQEDWDEVMANILEPDAETWMDEVYRLV